MRNRRQLLLLGNQKIGSAIHNWSLPAVESCPGASALCKEACYARRHRFRFDSVRRRLQWNWRQCRRDDFADRMISEIRSRGVLVLRVTSAAILGALPTFSAGSKSCGIVPACGTTPIPAAGESRRLPADSQNWRPVPACGSGSRSTTRRDFPPTSRRTCGWRTCKRATLAFLRRRIWRSVSGDYESCRHFPSFVRASRPAKPHKSPAEHADVVSNSSAEGP
jgi:hypothetical protein